VAHLVTVITLDLRPVLGFRTVAGEVTRLFAVAAKSLFRVLRLVAVLGHVFSGIAVAASTSGNVGTLSAVSMC